MTTTGSRPPAPRTRAAGFPWDVAGFGLAMLVMAGWALASGTAVAPLAVSLLVAVLAGALAVALLDGRRLLVAVVWGLFVAALLLSWGQGPGLFFARMAAVMLGATLASFVKEGRR